MKNVTYINAGAGSGKTFTLTQILADKLSEKSTKITPSQVILTTFTELAATEFREKARQQILSRDCADVAAQMDCAVIGTVHSVALTFIKKFWYLLEYGADIQTISERDADFYMSQSLARIVAKKENRNKLQHFRSFCDAFNISDSYGHPDYLFWHKYLNDVVEKMEYYSVSDIEESVKESLYTAGEIYSGLRYDEKVFGDLKEGLDEYRNHIAQKGNDKSLRQLGIVNAFLESNSEVHNLNDLKPLFEICKDPVDKSTIDKKCPRFSEFREKLNSLLISSSYLDIVKPFIESVFSLAKEWRDDFVTYKKANHIISYNDMEQLFLSLLNEEEVQEYVRANYRLVMVDEFQDSNPIQLKIFNKLAEIIAENDGHSYWVGDPKQAIYGFRGADTELINAVSGRFKFYNDAEIHPEEGEEHLGTGRLVESWRSRKQLVELVNNVFGESFKSDGVNELCIKLQPHFENDNLETAPIVYLKCDKGVNKEDALALKVKELLSSDTLVHHGKQDEEATKINPCDIAILCRKNDNCSKIVKSLRKFGIPVSEAEEAIMQRIEVMVVVNILQFVQNPSNKAVIANLLRLLYGYSTKEVLNNRISYIESLGEGKDCWMQDCDELKELLELKNEIKHLSIPEMVRTVVYKSNIPMLVERWGDAVVRRQNLSTIQHLAEDYDQMCLQMGMGTSISGFIYYLNSIEPDKDKDNKSNTVKVFTYHSAKGLEWPIVILTDLDEDALKDTELVKKHFMRVCEIVKESNCDNPFAREYYLHLFPKVLSHASSKPSDIMMKKITSLRFFEKLKKRVRSEERRLLYVGMTRAKDSLYTLEHYGCEFKWLTNVKIESTSTNVWGCCELKPVEIIDVAKESDSSAIAKYNIIEKPRKHNAYERKYLTPSRIKHFEGYNEHRILAKGDKDILTSGWREAEYSEIGLCIHDIFAVYRQTAISENLVKAQSVIEGYGLTDILSAENILQSAAWLHNKLQENFPQQQGDQIYNEYPFEVCIETGQHLRGEMDMLWFYTDEKGKHCILVDYKTFPGVDLNKHIKEYYAQLSAYTYALRKAGIDVTHTLVYYPVQRCIMRLSKKEE